MSNDLTNLTNSINEMADQAIAKDLPKITKEIDKFIEAAVKIDNPSTDETAKPK